MHQRGHEVFVFCLEHSRFETEAKLAGLQVIPIARHRKYYDFSKGRRFVGLLKKHQITHLLIRANRDMSILAYAKYTLGNRLHTAYFMEMQLGVKKTNPFHTARFRYIDLWACPLPWLQEQVKVMTKYPRETVLIPSGVNLSKFHPQPTKEAARKQLDLPHDVPIFGLMGRFDPQKGQLLLLDAMAHAQQKNFHVLLLGEPTFEEGEAYFESIEAMIETNQLTDRVQIRPFMKDVRSFYTAIDWFVMATRRETFGMVTVESLACGTPVLGSNAGGTPEILEHRRGGVLFETMNRDDLAAQIDQILNENVHFNSDDLRSMAQRYDHNSVCELVEKALGLN